MGETLNPMLRLAILGMIDGNGHPYSWSAIINGFDPELLKECPYAAIRDYLGQQPINEVGIPDARVTHVWTDNTEDAPKVAAMSLIPHVVQTPVEVIGLVDAVIIATDDGEDHVRRARPFVEAGLPVFIDKPLATNVPDLRQFIEWEKAGARIISSSGMRYAPELKGLSSNMPDMGDVRWVSSFSCNSWERYGIHALEALYPLIRDGVEGIRIEQGQDPKADIAYIRTCEGIHITIPVCSDAYGSFGAAQICGTKTSKSIRLTDTYTAFRGQLLALVAAFRTKTTPCPFSETVDMMAIIIAGIRSREEGSRFVLIDEIKKEIQGDDTPRSKHRVI